MKVYAAMQDEVPREIITEVMGSVELDGNTYYTRAFDSLEHLKTLCGTVQSRMEMAGLNYDGAWILPHGTKVPTKKKRFEVRGPLKVRDDYAPQGEPYPVLEMRPVYNKFYASEMKGDTAVIPPNSYYPKGLNGQDIRNHYASHAKEIMSQYAEFDINGTVSVKVNDKLVVKCSGSGETMESLNSGNTMEFFSNVGDNTRIAWLELEAGNDYPWSETRKVASQLLKLMGSMDEADVMSTELRFSGNNGFYIMSYLHSEIPTEDARKSVMRMAERYAKASRDPRITTDTGTSNSLCIKCGDIRMVGSLAYPTGLMCMQINPNEINDFQKWQAKIPGVGVEAAKYTRQQLMEEYYIVDDAEMDSMEKWLNLQGGTMTPQDISNVIGLRYAKLGEIRFVQLVQLLLDRDEDPDTIQRWVHGLSVLSLMPKYQASLRVRADYADPAMGRTWQDYIKQYNFNPEVGDLNPQYVEPIAPHTGREAMRWVSEMKDKVDYRVLQSYIAATLGIWIPIEHMAEFIERMNKFIPQEKVASTDSMRMWTIVGMMLPILKSSQKLEWKFVMGPWKCDKCEATNPPSSKHSCPECGAVQETETVVAMWRRKGSDDEWQEWNV